MSDPKTSPSEAVAFQDRLYVAGNASFFCLVVAILWAEFFVAKLTFSTDVLIILAAPLIATGATVLITGCSRTIVPKPVLSTPLQFTVPVIWSLICYLAVLMLSTQETGGTRTPEALIPALVWSKLGNLLPVCLIQIFVLSLTVIVTHRGKRI